MSEAREMETGFAAALHDLGENVADQEESRIAAGISVLISGIHSLGQRLEALEESMVRKFEGIQFERIEQQLTVIRDSETVNQKLFDSLHEELISYRDNFVRESLQKPFIRDLVVLFDDLTRLSAEAETGAENGGPGNAQLRDNLANTLHFLVEILHRLEVTEMETTETVDRARHRVIGVEKTTLAEEDGRIVARVKRGFLWRNQVLRPEEIIVRRYPAPASAPL